MSIPTLCSFTSCLPFEASLKKRRFYNEHEIATEDNCWKNKDEEENFYQQFPQSIALTALSKLKPIFFSFNENQMKSLLPWIFFILKVDHDSMKIVQEMIEFLSDSSRPTFCREISISLISIAAEV